ncbi:LOW QUALITY PROTEIN: protein SPMIP2 [Sarcoramphus papa]
MASLRCSCPDATRDYRTRKPEHTHTEGATSPATEGTSNANYLWRLAPPSSRGPIQAAEDKATHRYQSPWQPAPYILEQQGHNARGRLAWDSGSQEGCLHPRSKRAAMIRASQAPLLTKSKGLEFNPMEGKTFL